MKIRAFLIALLAVLTVAPAAQATAPPNVIQEKTLTATSTVQKFETTKQGGIVYVHIYSNGKELRQHYLGSCGASYEGQGIYIKLRLLDCRKSGHHPFLLRYVSMGKPKRFVVRLSTF